MAPVAAASIIEGLGLMPGGVVKLPSFGRVGVLAPDTCSDPCCCASCCCCCCCCSSCCWSSEASGERTRSSDTLRMLRFCKLGCELSGAREPWGAGMQPADAASMIDGVASRPVGPLAAAWLAVLPLPASAAAAGASVSHTSTLHPTAAVQWYRLHPAIGVIVTQYGFSAIGGACCSPGCTGSRCCV
jgi:hypothetical protein